MLSAILGKVKQEEQMAKNISTARNWIKHVVFLGFTLTVVFYSTNAVSDWQQRIGKEVVFIEMDSELQELGYFVSRKPDIGRWLPYKDYVGKKGEIVGVVEQRVFSFWKIRLETGEIVYVHKSKESREFSDQIDFSTAGLYFIDDYNKAKEKIEKFIWINQNRWKFEKQKLVTEDSNVSYPLEHLEKVKVVNVFTKRLGNSYGINPLSIKVLKSTGEVGFIVYDTENYFDNDPIYPSWDKSIVETIKKQKIRLGMTKDQVLLSWGKPESVNRTVTLYGTKEQWIYRKTYLYFEDNKLTAYQD